MTGMPPAAKPRKPLKLARSKAELWRTAVATISSVCSLATLVAVMLR